MGLKLTAIPTKTPKNKYLLVVEVMHGDADKYENVEIPCKNEKELIQYLEVTKDKHFKDYIPHDCTCRDYLAAITSAEGFYWNEHRVKFKVELD